MMFTHSALVHVRRAVLVLSMLPACSRARTEGPARSPIQLEAQAPSPPSPAVPAPERRPPAPFVVVPPPPLAREFRGGWVTPVRGGGAPDWPSAAGLPADSQRAELRALLDRARSVGVNAVILHVRAAGDAFYPTPLAPWTAFLSGESGVPPGPPAYDPLAFAIEEAHARGLQLHAWFNPFRAAIPGAAPSAAPNHVTRAHPRWIRRYGEQTWIDPGEPAARGAVLAAIMDVVRRYDVDGVHIDDYFYPYREQETIRRVVRRRRVSVKRDIPFPDDATWKRYGRPAGFTDRAAWRRANIDHFVERLYDSVRAAKPWLPVGISPFGIWRSGVPAGVTGLDAYGEIYADARRWLAEGWVDYIVPQLYWVLDGEQDRFTRLDAWWRTQNPHGRHIWPGLHTQRVVIGRQPWPAAEIPAQIDALRAGRAGGAESNGHVHFRLGTLAVGAGDLSARLQADTYAEPALVPASPWLGGPPPAAPTLVRGTLDSAVVAPGDGVGVAWWAVQERAADGGWSARVARAGGGPLALALDAGRVSEVAVSAVDRAGQQGPRLLLLGPRAGDGGGWTVAR